MVAPSISSDILIAIAAFNLTLARTSPAEVPAAVASARLSFRLVVVTCLLTACHVAFRHLRVGVTAFDDE